MSIWKEAIDVDLLNERGLNTMVHYLGIEFMEVGDDYLIARMPVDYRTKQPYGIMHGGASCVLAETIGSTGANYCINQDKQVCVGLDINTNHIRSISQGFVFGVANPFHIGATTQVWHIEIHNEQKKLISVTRLTMAVLRRKT